MKELRKAVDTLLEQLNARGELAVSGPTQMHRLLELAKKEQDVYIVVFFEMIRQVSWKQKLEVNRCGKLEAEIE